MRNKKYGKTVASLVLGIALLINPISVQAASGIIVMNTMDKKFLMGHIQIPMYIHMENINVK